jgi:hypothetical protein
MGGSYTNDEQAAAVLAGGIADTAALIKAGMSTAKAAGTATTTAVVAHGLGVAPDFCIAQSSKADVAAVAWAADTTEITFTVTSATAFTISYISGSTA